MATATTLPLEPLEKLAKSKADVPDYAGGSAPAGSTFTDELFATMIGVSTRAIARWRFYLVAPLDKLETGDLGWAERYETLKEAQARIEHLGEAYGMKVDGELPWHSADRAATSMGMHASWIWGDEWLALDSDVIEGGNETLNKLLDKALDKIGESAYFKAMQAADAERTMVAA